MRSRRPLLQVLLVTATTLACLAPAYPKTVEQVIQETLAAWRFKPGEEVFLRKDDKQNHQLALAASPQGDIYLVWGASENPRSGPQAIPPGAGVWGSSEEHPQQVHVVSSRDGRVWRDETTFSAPVELLHRLAVAANAAGQVVVACAVRGRAWIVERSADGKWGAPQPFPDLGEGGKEVEWLRADPTVGEDDSVWLLAAFTRPNTGSEHRLWRKPPGGEWTQVPAAAPDPASYPVGLGYRGAPIGILEGQLARLNDRGEWKALFRIPWEAEQGGSASRARSLWIRPRGEAAAVIDRPGSPLRGGAYVTFSPDLQAWTAPTFLGLRTEWYQPLAVAVTPHGTYLATDYEPFYQERDRERREGDESNWTAVRVFRLDDGLTRDTDEDGLSDLMEEWLLTDHQNPDTDGDGLRDGRDLDPLASRKPEGDGALILRAALWALEEYTSEGRPLMVVWPQRTALAAFSRLILCVTSEEAQAYQHKYYDVTGAAMTVFYLDGLEVDQAQGTASASWKFYTGPVDAVGGTIKFRKDRERWEATDKEVEWVS